MYGDFKKIDIERDYIFYKNIVLGFGKYQVIKVFEVS